MLTDNTSPVQKQYMHTADEYVITHPDIALLPSLGHIDDVSIEVRGQSYAICAAAVVELAGMFGLPTPVVSGDKRTLAASDHGICVWTAYTPGGDR